MPTQISTFNIEKKDIPATLQTPTLFRLLTGPQKDRMNDDEKAEYIRQENIRNPFDV